VSLPVYYINKNKFQNITNLEKFLRSSEKVLYSQGDYQTLFSSGMPTISANNFIKYNLEAFFKLMLASHLYIDDDFDFEKRNVTTFYLYLLKHI